jgi:hypothetical protein
MLVIRLLLIVIVDLRSMFTAHVIILYLKIYAFIKIQKLQSFIEILIKFIAN